MSQSEGFPIRLRKYREYYGWTQKQLGNTWGVSPETISAWENGRRKPDITLVTTLARELRMDESELVTYISASSTKLKRLEKSEVDPDEFEQHSLISVFRNQKACEDNIREASQSAKKIKVLTIRGDKYFVGTMSLLHDAIVGKKTSIEALVLSPEAEHITEELAGELQHSSANEIRGKMLISLKYLKDLAQMYENFSVNYYNRKPIFKMLIFDDLLFVSSFALRVPKNDLKAEMYKIPRGNSLFAGFEAIYDEFSGSSSSLD
jgi:DNA-binding XRE family transcriptional regulator